MKLFYSPLSHGLSSPVYVQLDVRAFKSTHQSTVGECTIGGSGERTALRPRVGLDASASESLIGFPCFALSAATSIVTCLCNCRRRALIRDGEEVWFHFEPQDSEMHRRW